jgi:kynureninase
VDKLKKIAINLDSNDELSSYRNEFILPNNTIYFDGNSLGVLSKNIINDINNTVREEWGNNLISSWNDKWIELPNKVSKKIASILNCNEDEVYVGSSTSNNLFKLIKSILEAHKDIKNISTDNLNFPSDKYICEGICKDFNLKFKFLDYKNDLLPDIKLLKRFIIDNPGIIVLSHVTYKSSYRYPIKEINSFCRENKSIVIWDLSHSIGAVDIDMESNKLDFAVGCTYKYLNGGPGSPAFIYVRENQIKKLKSPIKGWFSHNKPFNFSEKYQESNSMEKFSNGTPHILSLSTLKTSLDITISASTKKLEIKSHKLFELFESIYKEKLRDKKFKLMTLNNKFERGSHISLYHNEAWRISQCLISPFRNNSIKIIVDYRPNNIIRIALTPLYTSFKEIIILCERMIEIIDNKEFEQKNNTKDGVT